MTYQKIHGMTGTRLHRIWKGILSRCRNPKTSNFSRYGGRGIKVCKRWEKFENFRDDMFASYKKHVVKYGEQNTQIDRLDNDNGYLKKNCHWVTTSEQQRNRTGGKSSKSKMVGEKIGRLTVIDFHHSHKKTWGMYWLCQCDCGNMTIVPTSSLRRKKSTKSCGCLAKELLVQRNKNKV